MTDTISHISFAELQERFALLAGTLQAKGDRAVIYMPIVPEALYRNTCLWPYQGHPLGCLRWVRAKELATRIDEAISTAQHKPDLYVILQMEQSRATLVEGRDVGWVGEHSYICYGPLINGTTTVLFEGKPKPVGALPPTRLA